MYKELTSCRSDAFVCLLIRVSRVRTPDRAVGNHCFCGLESRGDGDFFVCKENINFLLLESTYFTSLIKGEKRKSLTFLLI